MAVVAVALGVIVASFALTGSAGGRVRAAFGAPTLLLPWEDSQSWQTGVLGFHTTSDALDFFPPDTPFGGDLICQGEPGWYEAISSYQVLASAAGVVTAAANAEVAIDHGNGWSSRYYHMYGFVVEEGDWVPAGQPLAHPSTYGFCTTGPHVHFSVAGPDGETTRDVALSGRPAAGIGVNEWISETGNVPAEPPPPEPTPPAIVAGDANCDGSADAVDALLVLRAVSGLSGAADCAAGAPDADCNGVVDAIDALALLRYAAGLEPALPACDA
jgi:hypothetical protein